MLNNSLFSSQTCLWSTPQHLFDELNEEFGFNLDVCALPENAKCDSFYTPSDDGLLQNWDGVCWCNPPYNDKINDWLLKARREVYNGCTVVFLLPSRTDVKWFHNNVLGVADEIRFIKGRLKFGGSENSAPFPSMVVIFKSKKI